MTKTALKRWNKFDSKTLLYITTAKRISEPNYEGNFVCAVYFTMTIKNMQHQVLGSLENVELEKDLVGGILPSSDGTEE
jgi:hypothetical protein